MSAPVQPVVVPTLLPRDQPPLSFPTTTTALTLDAGVAPAPDTRVAVEPEAPTKRTGTRRPRPPASETKAPRSGFGVPMAGSFDD